MGNLNYKEEIVSSRKGAMGGSDATMLAQIASIGFVPKSAQKRLAICKGLIERKDIVTTAMAFGDYIENKIYDLISAGNPNYESNPLLVSKKYSMDNVKLICHPDFLLKDYEKKILYVYECKATKEGVDETKIRYRSQMYVENILAKELASQIGSGWKVKTFLVHYSTEGLDLDQGFEFDESRMSVTEVRFNTQVFDVRYAMEIVNKYLEGLEYYTEDEDIDADYLPEKVRTQFTEVAGFLREIKEREEKVEEFKTKLYDFLSSNGIKKVSCKEFAFTLVAPSESVTVDYKKLFAEEIEAKRPRVAKKLKDKYKKTSKRKGFVQIRLSDEEKK